MGEPSKRPSFWYIDETPGREYSRHLCVQAYYNDCYRNNDISQGIVNQVFEYKNKNQKEKKNVF